MVKGDKARVSSQRRTDATEQGGFVNLKKGFNNLGAYHLWSDGRRGILNVSGDLYGLTIFQSERHNREISLNRILTPLDLQHIA
jgi:hypothetical protein